MAAAVSRSAAVRLLPRQLASSAVVSKPFLAATPKAAVANLWLPLHIDMPQPLVSDLWERSAPGLEKSDIVIGDDAADVVPMQAIKTRKELRAWKARRKQNGGRDRRYRLKYG